MQPKKKDAAVLCPNSSTSKAYSIEYNGVRNIAYGWGREGYSPECGPSYSRYSSEKMDFD